MKTLILGHSYYYKKTNVRCSPIDVELWYDKHFDCVDFMCDKTTTDFVYDIYRSIDYSVENNIKYDGYWVWKFSQDNTYNIIVDCTGSINWDKSKKQYRHYDELIKTIFRVLTTNGIFYSYFGIYTKMNNGKLLFEPKILNGYKYVD
jgi:hypothetical protein